MKYGNWKKGKAGNSVVSDKQTLPVQPITGHNEIDYYGGYLVAESIPDEDHQNLIAATPDLLEALESIENDDNSIPKKIWEMRNQAIKKAKEGVKSDE